MKLAGQNGLSKQQVNGITHLVAASVEGLRPENISIIDWLVAPIDDEHQHRITIYIDGNNSKGSASLLLDRNWIKKILSEVETGIVLPLSDA